MCKLLVSIGSDKLDHGFAVAVSTVGGATARCVLIVPRGGGAGVVCEVLGKRFQLLRANGRFRASVHDCPPGDIDT